MTLPENNISRIYKLENEPNKEREDKEMEDPTINSQKWQNKSQPPIKISTTSNRIVLKLSNNQEEAPLRKSKIIPISIIAQIKKKIHSLPKKSLLMLFVTLIIKNLPKINHLKSNLKERSPRRRRVLGAFWKMLGNSHNQIKK